MNRTHRYSLGAWICLMLFPVLATGCIIVVEEDKHDRHRHLHGTEWTLEVVFYRTQTLSAADRNVDVSFAENGRIDGTAACGTFTGFYEVNENGGFDVSTIEMHQNCQGEAVTNLFMDGLRDARTYEADEQSLRIATANNGYLSFSAD